MISSSLRHFPQIRFRDNQKHLWNPILKKSFKQRPEERVRLQFIEYLINEAGFSRNRISFESPVSLPDDKSYSRSDIICYDETFHPLLLVECKAPAVQLDERTAIQIARYNTKVGASFLMTTNGMRDFWFESKNEKVNLLAELPSMFSVAKFFNRTFEYWQKRGFVGSADEPAVRNWITENCDQLFIRPSNPVRYFSFDDSDPELFLSNYYQVMLINEQTRLAISFSSTPNQDTKLNAVLNQGGRNVGLLSASIDSIASGEPHNTMIQNNSGNRVLDIVKEVGFDFRRSIKDLATPLSRLIKG